MIRTMLSALLLVVALAVAASAGITRGCTPVRFCPDDPVTRAQMAALLHRALANS
jgi:hypothetical protein